MKRIATRPVHHPNVGVGQHFSIEIVFGTGIEQHIHDTGDGDIGADRIPTLWQAEIRHLRRLLADRGIGPVANADPAAGQADLAQHCGKSDCHPTGLFAVVAALDGPTHRDHRPRRRHPPSQFAQSFGIDTGDAGGPVRVFDHAIGRPSQVPLELVIPHAVPIEEFFVMQPLRKQRMGETEH